MSSKVRPVRRSAPSRLFEELESRRLLSATHAVNSGDWLEPTTWDNGVPTLSVRAIVDPGVTVSITSSATVAKEVVIHGTLQGVEPAGNDEVRSLTADWIHVNSGGLFRVGEAADRFATGRFTITLTGDDPDADFSDIETVGGSINVTNNNAFLMASGGGSIQFFGAEKLSFTKLAKTANVGQSSITVHDVIERNFDNTTSADSDGSLDWTIGDEIVVASSSYSYAQEDVRTIVAVQSLGDGTSRLTLDAPLQHRHHGEIEVYGNGEREWELDLRAEVSRLNRSIVVQGDESSDTDNAFGDRARWAAGASDGVGGHLMIMGSAGQITLDGVQFDRMGQTGRLGRYPVHWHVAGDRSGDVLRNASVTNSNNRGVTLHGTQNVLLEDNVLHDIHGHGIFMEDGAEFGNRFLSNVVLGIHRVGGGGASADPFVVPGVTRGADGRVNGEAPRGGNGESSHDTGQNVPIRFLHSASYWITNPDNTWVGNVSAGSEGTGFWFALPNRVLGLSRDTGLYPNYLPNRQNLEQFDHNTTHSAPVGLTFDRGSDISGTSFNNHYAPPQRPVLNHLTAYKHQGTAVYHRGANTTFNESRFADNANSSFSTFTQIEKNVLFVGHSRGNADTSVVVGGFRLYDGPGQIQDSHFAGFQRDNAHTFRVEGGANKHAHTRASGISFGSDGTAEHLSIEWQSNGNFDIDPQTGSVSGRPDAASGVVLDVDGSLTGHAGGEAGSVLVPKLEFYRDGDDLAPEGWDAYISNDRYAQLKIGSDSDQTVPPYRITNESGNAFVANRYNLRHLQRQYAKLNAGDYTVAFLGPMPAGGFSLFLQARVGGPANASTVMRFLGVGETMKPTSGVEVPNLQALRSATSSAFYRAGDGDLWVKRFAGNQTTRVETTDDPPPADPPVATVVARHAFYNGSAFDGNNAAANAADDDAIATDKQALLPGQTATFANVTSYHRGVNGIALDIRDLASASLQADDFAFAVGDGTDPAGFVAVAITPVIDVRLGGGVDGADRVSLVLPDGTARNQWLRVTVRANAAAGLTEDDTFYFGNLPGETGNSTGTPRVSTSDIRRTAFNSGRTAEVDNLMDHNRSGRITSTDIRLAAAGSGASLALLAAPGPAFTRSLDQALVQRAAASYAQWQQLLGEEEEDADGDEVPATDR